MFRLKVALIQPAQSEDAGLNVETALHYCRLAKGMDSDIALFPEMFTTGYFFPSDKSGFDMWNKKAIDKNDRAYKSIENLAKELDMAVAFTYLSRNDPLPNNTVSLIDRTGNTVLTYSKVHTCDFGGEKYCQPGNGFFVSELNTRHGRIKVGAMICFDREFPESSRILMLKGAELILVPNACRIEANRKAQLMTRAYENMVGIAMANYSGDVCFGKSLAFDGVSFDVKPDGSGVTRDHCILECGEKEGVYVAEFDIDKMREFRRKEVWGNSFRKPYAYSELILDVVNPPFVRKESRRMKFEI
jgi:predicted amidohydrolase